jgi:two-component system chemotaxis response regulator CheY
MKPRVLVVDDSVFMRTAIASILVSNGIDVVGEAEHGRMAVDLYQELKPDLVTMDIIMPEMSGIDAAREILAMDGNANIITCSALGQKALVDDALKAGARDFLIKPFNPSKVMEVVEAVLNLAGHDRSGK